MQEIGLTDKEISALPVKQTIVNSDRYGVMFQVGSGDLHIGDGTVFNCGREIFLTRASAADIHVDGSHGATLNSANGVIIQAMEVDRPSTWGARVDPYVEPYGNYEDIPLNPEHDNSIIDPAAEISCGRPFSF